jgi:hypothetical protein
MIPVVDFELHHAVFHAGLGGDSQNFLRSFFVLKKFLRKVLKIWYSQIFKVKF